MADFLYSLNASTIRPVPILDKIAVAGETGYAGIKLAMEFLGVVDDINTIEDALEIVEKAGDPDGTIVLDPFHIFRGGGSVESISRLSAEQVAICHFNDAPAFPPRARQHDPDRV